MKKIAKIISSLSILIAIVLIVIFRTIPAGKLWEEYRVLYVTEDSKDSSVLNAINEAGISDVVSLSGQFLPVSVSEKSLEYAMFKATMDSDKNEYIYNRKSYFFDKSHNYRLYYIPREYEHSIGKCISYLKKQNIECGLDSNSEYPFIFPVIVALMTIAVCFFCKNKLLFICSAVLPVLYVFCNPFFQVALSICLIIFCSFFVSNIWRREGAVSYLNSFLFIPICFAAALLCAFDSSLLSGFIFLAVIAGTVSVFYCYYWIQDYFRNRKPFVPVYIRPAKIVNIRLNEFKVVFSIVLCASLFLLTLYLFINSESFSSRSDGMQMPGVSDVESSELPQLEDYYKWAWNFKTYPYRSLNASDYSDEESVTFPIYTSEDGIISVSEKKINYDDEFKNEVFANIDNLNFNSIEEVMKSEGDSFKGGYNSTSSFHIDLFGIIVIIMCYLILIFIYFSIIIRAKKVLKNDIR